VDLRGVDCGMAGDGIKWALLLNVVLNAFYSAYHGAHPSEAPFKL
jgi:hypothetical protein